MMVIDMVHIHAKFYYYAGLRGIGLQGMRDCITKIFIIASLLMKLGTCVGNLALRLFHLGQFFGK